MADVLDQNEVDALLSAVESGEVPAAREESAVETLGDVKIYDFKRPERVSKDQIRAIRNVHETFARNFGASLSTYLRTIVDIKLASVEQLTYYEFIMSLPNPTCFNLISAEPLEGEMVLEINPTILYPLIDRLLGGGGLPSTPPDRPLTEIEMRLVDRVTSRALEELKVRWEPIKKVNLKVSQIESNPQLMQIVSPNEVVVLICFEITMGSASGMMNFCIPFPVIESVVGEFTTHHWFTSGKQAEGATPQAHIKEGLRGAPLGVVAYLASTKISVSQLLELEVGDVLQTEKPSQSELLVEVEGRQKFRGRAGLYRGMKAIKVTEIVGQDAR